MEFRIILQKKAHTHTIVNEISKENLVKALCGLKLFEIISPDKYVCKSVPQNKAHAHTRHVYVTHFRVEFSEYHKKKKKLKSIEVNDYYTTLGNALLMILFCFKCVIK